MYRTLRSRVVKFVVLAAVAACALVPISLGLGKSLWRDEAWVANSILSASLRQVFYYDDWLQTSPPLFLLLTRWTVQTFGNSNWAFRVVPFLAYLVAAALWWLLVRRLFSRWQAVFAWALLVLNATAVLYASQMKQYCTDLASSTALLLVFVLYLERPATGRMWLLVAVAGAGLLLSYPLILLMPGVLVAVWRRGGWRRATALALLAAAIFAMEYRWLIATNSSDDLRAFWTSGAAGLDLPATRHGAADRLFDVARLPIPVPLMTRPWLLMGMVGVWIAAGFSACWRRFRREAHRWAPVLIACGIACALAMAADLLALYPISYRTSLSLLPALLLTLAGVFELLFSIAAAAFGRARVAALWGLAMVGATCAIATVFVRAQWNVPFGQPEEDMQAAVSFLKPAVEHGDALWVHATAAQAFKLYSGIQHWRANGIADGKTDGLIAWGNTGWTCCRRPSSGKTDGGPAAAVSTDMESKLPGRLPARMWFLFSSSAIKLESASTELLNARAYLAARGCTETPGVSFTGIRILSFQCSNAGRAR